MQQDKAPVYPTRETVELLQTKTSYFIPLDFLPPNSPGLNPVDYQIWATIMQELVRDRNPQRWWTDTVAGAVLIRKLLLRLLTSSVKDRAQVRVKGDHFKQTTWTCTVTIYVWLVLCDWLSQILCTSLYKCTICYLVHCYFVTQCSSAMVVRAYIRFMYWNV